MCPITMRFFFGLQKPRQLVDIEPYLHRCSKRYTSQTKRTRSGKAGRFVLSARSFGPSLWLSISTDFAQVTLYDSDHLESYTDNE